MKPSVFVKRHDKKAHSKDKLAPGSLKKEFKTSTRTLKNRAGRKTSPIVEEALRLAIKNKAWSRLAQILSNSTRRYASVNLSQIDSQTTAGDTIVIIGKVLGVGELTKKVRICALGSSATVKDKIKASKSELVSIKDEIIKNPKAEGIKLLQ